MIHVNLLQEQKKKSSGLPRPGSVRSPKPFILAAFGVAVAAVAAVDVQMFLKLKSIRAEQMNIQRRMTSPAHVGELARAKELQAELDALNRKKAIIVDLIENRIHWSKKLGTLRDNLPSDIWIEKIALTNPTNTRDDPFQTLRISAATTNYARGHARVAETIQRLDSSPDFMHGFVSPLIDTEIRNEKWDPAGRDESVDATVCRFTFQAKRPLPETEKEQQARR